MTTPEIVYLSEPEPVSMGDEWFSIATTDHFWIRRRFDVLRALTPDVDWPTLRLAEIGCGSGLLQRQFEDAFGASVDGFDLNVVALQQSAARSSSRICYNIAARDASLRQVYDGLFLFDVIEHVSDDREFLVSALFHLRPGGRVFINVPADPRLFSSYDEAVGHVRRYVASDLIGLVQSLGMHVVQWTYWGRPLLPLLRIRQRRLRDRTDRDQVLRDGFSPRGSLINQGLSLLSRAERIPQHRAGSSLMFVAQVP